MVRRVEITCSQTTTREEDAHLHSFTTFGVTGAVWQPLGLEAVIARDLDTQGLGVGSITVGGQARNHSEARRKRLDILALCEVIDSSAGKDLAKRPVLVLIVECTRMRFAQQPSLTGPNSSTYQRR